MFKKVVWSTIGAQRREALFWGTGVRKDVRERIFEMNIKHGMGFLR